MKRLAPQDRPREKLARAGAAALGENELVALLLGSGVPERDALHVAEDVLERVGGVSGLARMGLDELLQVPGVGLSRGARLLAAVELGRRVVAGSAGERPVLSSPASVAGHLLALYGGHRVERFGLVLLDTKYRLIRTAILSIGSLDASIADPREIFRAAALASASAIVVFHNHPSGDPRPSAEDVHLTARLRRAGEVMGIEVVDHVILGDGRWFSFKEAMRL